MWLGNRYMSEKRGICDINPKLKLLFPHRITKRAALLRLSWGREVGRRSEKCGFLDETSAIKICK